MQANETEGTAGRAIALCHACGYCEGFCAVFPAILRHRRFTPADLEWLAHLCHGCRGCYYACQYAPPHPFALNLPRQLAELRLQSYADHAWPRPLARAFQANGTVLALAMGGGLALAILLVAVLQDPAVLLAAHPAEPGAFYKVIPHAAMAVPATAVTLFALLAMAMGLRSFWRAAGPRARARARAPGAWRAALRDALTLKNLDGGGHGCNDRDESLSGARRHLHHALFYGFALCFASTSVATLYAMAGWAAPYPILSLPVLLGTVGGVGMVAGAGGLLALRLRGDPAPAAPRLLGPDVAMLVLLGLVALTGLALLALRTTGAMGLLLAVHLGFVLALFVALPYSRLVHGLYRLAALWRDAIETRQPPPAGGSA